MKTLYPNWRMDVIADARRKVQVAERALDGLQDKTTIYARSIAAVADMHRKALAVYENSPEAIGEAA